MAATRKSKQVNIRLEPEEIEALQRVAAQQGDDNISALVRRLLRQEVHRAKVREGL